MYRCLVLAFALWASAAAAQVQRAFPPDALRGEISFGMAPEVAVNGQRAMLAPGARIRDKNNMLAMSASLAGVRLTVHYTIDINGQVKDVWILRPDELANQPWPANLKESQTWAFDPIAQRWAKR